MEDLPLQSLNERSTKADFNSESHPDSDSPFEILCAADERVNPAILLAEELTLKAMQEIFDFAEIERAEEVLYSSRAEISRIENQLTALIKTPSTPALSIPVGF